ncbi:MAG: peptide/nickel transport system substrate-binding protein [Actinomycetota bacterium]|nr:peptide/nickel transport system substrate-binding protein [Actinomycetota bacterium]
MTHPRLVPLLGAALTALALAACSSVGSDGSTSGSGKRSDDVGGTAQGVKQGGTVTVALSAEPDFLDPTLAASLYSRYVFSAMCEKLYDLDKDVRVVPQLAKSMPQVSDDGKTVTIALRDGVKFADGTPFNSEAVKASLDRDLTNPQSARVSELGPIASVEATDPTTVTINLKTPFAPLTAVLADRAGMVMSPKQLKAKGDDFGNDPVCVGPFKFAKRVPQNSIELAKDPNYYDAAKVHLDRIVYRIITDGSIRAANLRSGDAQVADTLGTDDVPELKKDAKLQVLESPSLGYQGVTFNVGNIAGVGKPTKTLNQPYAKDPRIRQAFEYAIDRQALVDNVFNGQFDPACGPVAPQSEFSSDAVQQCRKYDPAQAKKLLKQAGVPVPYKFSMLTSNTPATLQFAQALQAMVKQGGFELKIEPVEFTSLLDQQDRGKFQLLQLGWSGRVDPDGNITNFVGTGGSQNVAGYSNPALDKLLEQARQSQDTEARGALYGQAQGLLQRDDPLIYLYRQRNLTGVAKQLSGVQVYSDGILRIAFAGFKS